MTYAVAPEPGPSAQQVPQAAPAPAADRGGALLRLLAGRRAGLLIVCLGALFLLPLIGHFGLWDPQEVRLLEQSREVSHFTVPERLARPPLPLIVTSLSLRVFGMTELGGRVPVALAGLCTLAALVALGSLLGRRRAGALAALVLLSVPVFALGARQGTTHLWPMLGQVLAVLGLSTLWLRPGRAPAEPVLGALAALLGLGMGFFSAGALLGLAPPLLAVAIAFALCGGPRLPIAVLSALAGLSLAQPLRLVLASAQLSSSQRLTAAGVLCALGLLALFADRGGGRRRLVLGLLLIPLGLALLPALPKAVYGYSPWFSGFVRWPLNREIQVDSILKPIGFQLFPWAALLPMALVALLSGRSPADQEQGPDPADQDGRSRLAELLPLSWFAVAYLLSTYQAALTTEPPFPALGALALAIGLYLDQAFGSAQRSGAPSIDDRAGSRLAGLCAALISLLLGRDLFLNPEQYGSAHFPGDLLRWPAPLLWVAQALVGFSALFGVVLGLSLAFRGALRRNLLLITLGVALLGSLASIYGLIPALSQHVSYRGVFTKYKKLGGSVLGVYGVPRSGAKFYDQQIVELSSIQGVFDFLAKDPRKRAFALIGAQELAPVDQQARQHNHIYYVVDDSNVQFLLLSNQLAPGEADLNPLRRLVLDKEPHPQHVVRARFEERLELLGYDLPAELSLGHDFVIRLYFHVLQPVGGTYKVFIHFDGAGTRWNGDHVPLDGKYPTNNWSPGYYIIDEHHMTTSRMGQPAGVYQIYMGLWPGGDGARIKVTEGPQDGESRVKLGVVKVK